MRRRKTRRAVLGPLAAMLAIACSVLTIGAAQASTIAAGGAHLGAAVAGRSVPALAGSGPQVTCPAGAHPCTYNSGWVATYPANGCEADTTVQLWPATDQMNISTQVHSSNLFSSCTVYSTLFSVTEYDELWWSQSYYGFACAVLDPSCSDTQTWSDYNVGTGIPISDASGPILIWVVESNTPNPD